VSFCRVVTIVSSRSNLEFRFGFLFSTSAESLNIAFADLYSLANIELLTNSVGTRGLRDQFIVVPGVVNSETILMRMQENLGRISSRVTFTAFLFKPPLTSYHPSFLVDIQAIFQKVTDPSLFKTRDIESWMSRFYCAIGPSIHLL
jgi:hypothetical protein